MNVTSKESYHHGNLRQALMDAALVSIKDKGSENLSLRALAREIGVSQAAPYRHFEDKVALLSALAGDGFFKLAGQMRECMQELEQDPVSALQQGARAYIRFAQNNPETYRLMYSMHVEEFDDEEMEACHHEAFNLLEKTVETGIQSGAFKAHDKDAVVLASWSVVHGFAQLIIDGVVDLDDLEIESSFKAIGIVMNEGIVA